MHPCWCKWHCFVLFLCLSRIPLWKKAMAPHSSTLAWKIPWMEEPGGLQSMGSLRVNTTEQLHFHFPFMHWRRKWHPTPVLLPGESQGRGAWWAASLDMTEPPQQQQQCSIVCMNHIVLIRPSVSIVSVSWLLSSVLQWTLECV